LWIPFSSTPLGSSGASDFTLPSGSKVKTRGGEEGARYWIKFLGGIRGFFVGLSLKKIGKH